MNRSESTRERRTTALCKSDQQEFCILFFALFSDCIIISSINIIIIIIVIVVVVIIIIIIIIIIYVHFSAYKLFSTGGDMLRYTNNKHK